MDNNNHLVNVGKTRLCYEGILFEARDSLKVLELAAIGDDSNAGRILAKKLRSFHDWVDDICKSSDDGEPILPHIAIQDIEQTKQLIHLLGECDFKLKESNAFIGAMGLIEISLNTAIEKIKRLEAQAA